jgi:hypothetical protein
MDSTPKPTARCESRHLDSTVNVVSAATYNRATPLPSVPSLGRHFSGRPQASALPLDVAIGYFAEKATTDELKVIGSPLPIEDFGVRHVLAVPF